MLQIVDTVDEQPRIHERFAEVEHADFLDAGVTHLARDPLEEAKVHVPLRLYFACAQCAESAPIIAARRDLDLDTLGWAPPREGLPRDVSDVVNALRDGQHQIFLRLQACAVLRMERGVPTPIARIQFHVTGEQTRRIAIEVDGGRNTCQWRRAPSRPHFRCVLKT